MRSICEFVCQSCGHQNKSTQNSSLYFLPLRDDSDSGNRFQSLESIFDIQQRNLSNLPPTTVEISSKQPISHSTTNCESREGIVPIDPLNAQTLGGLVNVTRYKTTEGREEES